MKARPRPRWLHRTTSMQNWWIVCCVLYLLPLGRYGPVTVFGVLVVSVVTWVADRIDRRNWRRDHERIETP